MIKYPKKLYLTTEAEESPSEAPWACGLVELGAKLNEYTHVPPERQLIVALSVPSRKYVASLLSAGWVLASQPPDLPQPTKILKEAEPGLALRLVNATHIIHGKFRSYDEQSRTPRFRFAESAWEISSVRALAYADDFEGTKKTQRPILDGMEQILDNPNNWDNILARPASDLSIVGRFSQILSDLETKVSTTRSTFGTPLGNIVLPKNDRSATWFTRLYSSAKLGSNEVPDVTTRAVILDGTTAINSVSLNESPLIITIHNRDAIDTSSMDLVMQYRNNRGQPIELLDELKWRNVAGIEVVAFTVKL